MGFKIGVDMDGVLADFTGSALRRVNEVWGVEIKYEEVVIPRMGDLVYERLSDEQKAMYEHPRQLYGGIAGPGFFENLEPYEGAIDTLKTLDKEHDVVIITKPLEWDMCPGEKYTWLNEHLGYKPKMIMVNSMEAKGLVDVDIMIDDDPRVAKSLTTAIPIVVRHPWNEEDLKLEAWRSVESFKHTPEVIREIMEAFYDPQIAY